MYTSNHKLKQHKPSHYILTTEHITLKSHFIVNRRLRFQNSVHILRNKPVYLVSILCGFIITVPCFGLSSLVLATLLELEEAVWN